MYNMKPVIGKSGCYGGEKTENKRQAAHRKQ